MSFRKRVEDWVWESIFGPTKKEEKTKDPEEFIRLSAKRVFWNQKENYTYIELTLPSKLIFDASTFVEVREQ